MPGMWLSHSLQEANPKKNRPLSDIQPGQYQQLFSMKLAESGVWRRGGYEQTIS
ncbi:hypothetical protein PVK06_021831 [Gossypium arboreum]|uniref:Uncharacterized protein n=1 Tax=Gossypium arboreum TaxID=29729 RepID=A0ABR0PR23_GOSAR|nr:hypothetical protein PVK06_021831 [Gossypium arboreum]